jgi:hypothetical protein
VDDRIHSLDGTREAVDIRHVPLDELAAPRAELAGALGVPYEATHRAVLGAQRVHDPRSDEACPPGDQDHDADSTSRRPWIVCISLRSADRLI